MECPDDAPLTLVLADEPATVALGEALGRVFTSGVIYLHGQLGAGKTTLCRGIMRSRGHGGAVKSPTYTLVEPYTFADGQVFHFDLYRLNDPEELEFMGVRDYFHPDNLCIVEWPERGEGVLPAPDIDVTLGVEGRGRVVTIMSHSPQGSVGLTQLRHAADKI